MPISDTLLLLVERAASELPYGYSIILEVENGCGLVRLSHPDDTVTTIDNDDQGLCATFEDALKLAKDQDRAEKLADMAEE